MPAPVMVVVANEETAICRKDLLQKSTNSRKLLVEVPSYVCEWNLRVNFLANGTLKFFQAF